MKEKTSTFTLDTFWRRPMLCEKKLIGKELTWRGKPVGKIVNVQMKTCTMEVTIKAYPGVSQKVINEVISHI